MRKNNKEWLLMKPSHLSFLSLLSAFDLAKGIADKSFMESARTLLSRIMLRRTKDEVELSL